MGAARRGGTRPSSGESQEDRPLLAPRRPGLLVHNLTPSASVFIRPLHAHSTRRKDGKQVAIKIIDLEESKDDVQTICREITTLVSSSCPQLINYYGSAVFGTKLV